MEGCSSVQSPPGLFESPPLLLAPNDPELGHIPGGGHGQQVPIPLPRLQQEGPSLQIILESEHGLEVISSSLDLLSSGLQPAEAVEQKEEAQ